MSLEKSIKSGKEHRTPYRGAKSVSASCCNHGDDDWSMSDRTFNYDKKIRKSISNYNDYIDYIEDYDD